MIRQSVMHPVRSISRLAFATSVSLCIVILAIVPSPLMSDEASDIEFFEKQIRPILIERCYECHSDEKHEGGLRLTSRELLLQGGETGAAVVPGKPDESLLIRAVGYVDELKMPPKGKLSESEIEKLTQWVAMGAVFPGSTTAPTATEPHRFEVTPDQKSWWAFQPIRDPAPPDVKNVSWPQNEIDRFILAELVSHNLSPADPASRRAWIRRATFDLTGLPPTPEEVDAFLTDSSPDAYANVIDRLLASPAYGQRWARHWLDVVRYADYHDGDPTVRAPVCEPLQAWRYRDWVVASFNNDLPFDQFIVHQIAGDLLPVPEGREFYADGIIATTFLSNGSWDRGDADKEKMLSDMVDDNIDTIGKAFMGLTLGCARCHDHKFDPISNEDYYALAGVFYSTRILKELGGKGDNYTLNRVPLVEHAYLTKRDEQLKLIVEVNAKLAELDKKSPKPADDDPERVALVGQRDTLQSELLPEPPTAEAASEGGVPGSLFPGIQDVPIHIRGSYTRLGPIIARRMPQFFSNAATPRITTGSGRREVAAWVTAKENPLTARVIVNRVWQWHFSTGLVRTPNNFGMLSEQPSHPQLLDWLATQFIADDGSLKKLHRRIMLSATYQQSSAVPQEQLELDPENRWLGRFSARRLEAEAIRDAMLAATRKLDTAAGGPATHDLNTLRRSLYVQTARWDRSSFATLFDAANPDASEERRNVSTVAPQSLFLLNHEFTLTQARQLAERLIREVPGDSPESEMARIQLTYQLLFARPATEEELAIARLIVSQGATPGDTTGWTDLAHVLLCSNEFVYID
ncbi:MAG: PSD1 and planctomycete cytochrome C domain-containing protein [Planctomycetaceae bacterium]